MVSLPEKKEMKQEIGLRIWNEDKSAVLVYLLNKSTTWTLPTIKDKGVLDTLSEQLLNVDIASAICIVNTKDSVPVICGTAVKDIIYNYVIYDITIENKGIRKVKTPSHVRASHFMTFESASSLAYKTPLLNHLVRYMKTEEESCY